MCQLAPPQASCQAALLLCCGLTYPSGVVWDWVMYLLLLPGLEPKPSMLTLPHAAVHSLNAAQCILRPVVCDIRTTGGAVFLRCTHWHAAVDRDLHSSRGCETREQQQQKGPSLEACLALPMQVG